MSPNNNANRRYLLGGAYKKNTASAPNVSPVEPKAKLTLEDIFVVVDSYEFPREDRVPAGYYVSEVKDVQLREKQNGTQLIDVLYEIEGYDYKNRGQVFHVKQAYALESEHLKKFFAAMVDAGVKADSNITAAIGVVERIKLAYISDTSDLGSIVARVPYKEEAETDEEEDISTAEVDEGVSDPDFDDFLPDDED